MKKINNFKFDMSIEDSSRLFRFKDNVVIVDTFDNKTFNIRYGTMDKTFYFGSINLCKKQLNIYLDTMFNYKTKYINTITNESKFINIFTSDNPFIQKRNLFILGGFSRANKGIK